MAKVKLKNKKSLAPIKNKLRGRIAFAKTKKGIIARKWPIKKAKKMIYKASQGVPFVVRETAPAYGVHSLTTPKLSEKVDNFSVVSLFSGCGGLDLGFVGGFDFLGKKYSRNKFDITWANDIDEASCRTFANYFRHGIVCGDIKEILSGKHNKLFDLPLPLKSDIVIGGFPCQDFSHAGKRLGFDSDRGVLYKSMAEVIKRVDPLIFVAENVRGLLTMNGGEAIKKIKKDFDSLGYNVIHKLVTAADYGVPQMRQRVIIVGTKKGELPEFEYPDPIFAEDKWTTLKEALGDLENLPEGKLPNHFWSNAKKNNGQGNSLVSANRPGPTMRTEHHGNIEYHWNGKRRLSAREAARIQSFPDDFIFYPSTSSAYKQIGNAVPPVLAWHIAKSVEKFLNKYLKKNDLHREA